MASTITAKGKAPYRVRLTVANSTGETANVSQAAILAACMPGPLRSYLSKIPANDSAWFGIGQGLDPRVSYSVTCYNGAITFLTSWMPNVLGNTVDIVTSGAGAVMIEIIFNHSVVR